MLVGTKRSETGNSFAGGSCFLCNLPPILELVDQWLLRALGLLGRPRKDDGRHGPILPRPSYVLTFPYPKEFVPSTPSPESSGSKTHRTRTPKTPLYNQIQPPLKTTTSPVLHPQLPSEGKAHGITYPPVLNPLSTSTDYVIGKRMMQSLNSCS